MSTLRINCLHAALLNFNEFAVVRRLGIFLWIGAVLFLASVKITAADSVRPIHVIEREELELSGSPNLFDLLITRGGSNVYGINRGNVLGTLYSVFFLNGRPIPNVVVGYTLESLPVSQVDRIEVLGSSSAATLGDNSFSGAINIVTRRDFNGFEISSGVVRPTLKGGDQEHGSIVWGGSLGEGHLTFGIDQIRIEEVRDIDREYSRALYDKPEALHADTTGVSFLGNTVLYLESGVLKSAILGDCEGSAYVVLDQPRGAEGKGCGFAYADIAWQTESLERTGYFVSFDHPLGDDAELYFDGRYATGETKFRFAPSPDTLYFPNLGPGSTFAQIQQWLVDNRDIDISGTRGVLLGHRFIGHGNRDWGWDINEHDLTLGVKGALSEGIDYDFYVRNYRQLLTETGNTFVSESLAREQISLGNYNFIDPLSDDPIHQEAIRETSLLFSRTGYSNRRSAGLTLSGNGPSLGDRNSTWKLGAEMEYRDLHNRFSYKDSSDNPIEDADVLGSGGRPGAGERRRRSAISEVTLPLMDRWDLTLSGRLDNFTDAGISRNTDVSTRIRLNEFLALRGSKSRGTAVPSIYAMNADPSITHPYVRIGGSRSRTRIQVSRTTAGNPNLKPFHTKSFNAGVVADAGPVSVSADWFKIDQAGRPASLSSQFIINIYERAPDRLPEGVVVAGYETGNVSITAPRLNIGHFTRSGVDIRLLTSWKVDSVNFEFDTHWLRITDSKSGLEGRLLDDALPKDRVHATIRATAGDVTASWRVNAESKFKSRLVDDYYPAWIGHDLSLKWKNAFTVENLELIGGIQNVTNEGPPINPSLTQEPLVSLDSQLGRTYYLKSKITW